MDVDHVHVWTQSLGVSYFTGIEGGARCPVRLAELEGLWTTEQANGILSWTTYDQWWKAISAAEEAEDTARWALLTFCMTVRLKRLYEEKGTVSEAFPSVE